MTELDLRPFAARVRAMVDASPPKTHRETRAWLVDPVLEVLGWDVHDDACLVDRSVDGTHFEYVPTVASTPASFVAVEPYPSSLESVRASAICRAMAWTGVDRAIYTNGRRLALFAGTTDVDQFTCSFAEIDDYESALVHFSRERLAQRLDGHSREHVARTLALDRDEVADSIVETLSTVGGSAHEREFEAATDRFLEQLVASFATGDAALPAHDESDDDGVSIQFTDPAAEPVDRSEIDDQTAASTGGIESNDTIDDRSTESTAPDREGETEAAAGVEDDRSDEVDPADDTSTVPDDDEGGEYVVRFFADRGSIGAIGHSTSERALVHAAEYCFDRGLSGVSVPWGPDDGDETVLNDEPVHDDGSRMARSERLSNGLYLNTGGNVADRADRVEALASRAGLRAMLTGDWEIDRQ